MRVHNLSSSYKWLEPSVGSGAFYKLLPATKRIGIDIDPKQSDDYYGVVEHDFLTYELPKETYITIGNPPFGKNSSLAIKFFNRCAENSAMIAFIVPKTFKKISVINKLDRRFSLVHEEDLPKFSFTLDGENYDVPCVFQIWKKTDTPRQTIQTVLKHEDFEFVTRDVADFAIQRVGVNAGSIKSEFSQCASQSHHFIKAVNNEVEKVMRRINWDDVKFNTAGNPSISKHEIIDLYQKNKGIGIDIDPVYAGVAQNRLLAEIQRELSDDPSTC